MKQLTNVILLSAAFSLAITIAGFFGKWHFLLDLCSHFRVQAAGTLLIASPLLLVLKQSKWAAVCLLIGCLLSATLWPFFDPFQAASKGRYRLLSINVLTTNTQHDRVIDSILKHDPDFILLQETNSQWVDSLDKALLDQWPYRRAIPRSDNFGIAMYSKMPWESCEVVEYSAFRSTPSLVASFQLASGKKLRLIATHPLPPIDQSMWQSRNSHFSELAADVRKGDHARTIVAGDLNCTPWSYWFSRLVQESSLRNSAVGHGLNITWLPLGTSVCGLPLDHVLVGDGIQISQRKTGSDVGSDHLPVILDFQ